MMLLHFQIKARQSCSGIDVKDVLMDMRQYRMGLIQTFQQLRFSYLAIIEGACSILSIAMSPDSGFGGDQELVSESVFTNSSAVQIVLTHPCNIC